MENQKIVLTIKLVFIGVIFIFVPPVYAEGSSFASQKIFLSQAHQGQGNAVAEYLYIIGKEYYDEGNLEQAIHELKKALMVDSEHSLARKYLEKAEKILNDRALKIREERRKELAEDLEKAKEKLQFEQLSEEKPEVKAPPAAQIPAPPMIATPQPLSPLPEPSEVATVSPLKISGEYRMGFGITEEDFIWKEADANRIGVPGEKNWRYLWGDKRQNTYDPRIYSRFSLDMNYDTDSPLDVYGKIVIDPWTFIGTSDVTVTRGGGLPPNSPVHFKLKYWSNTGRTINEAYRSSAGDVVYVPEIKVIKGNTTPVIPTYAPNDTPWTDIPIVGIKRMYRPLRKFWVDYTEDEYMFRVFPLAGQAQALTTDDPLVLSNNHVYWEGSPWLDEYEPSMVFARLGDPIKRGRWIKTIPFLAKDSDQERLTFLRGAHFEGDFNSSLEATIATPMNLWDNYDRVTSIPGAVRFKKEFGDNLLGLTYTLKMGLDNDELEALNQAGGVDFSYQVLPELGLYAEVAGSWIKINEEEQVETSYGGMACKVGLLNEIESDYGFSDVELSFTYMHEQFYPALSNYAHTRRDQFYSKHIRFSELAPEDEAIRLGNGIDRGRNVVNIKGAGKSLDDKIEFLLNCRNVSRSSGGYVETVLRAEADYQATSKLTSKFLALYQHLPKTTAGFDPLINTKSSYSFSSGTLDFNEEDTFLVNDAIEAGKDPSIGTFSAGVRYDFNQTLAAEGIYELTNDPLDFPRGLINEVSVGTVTTDNVVYDRLIPFLHHQQPFGLPPYKYYNVAKAKIIYRPVETLTSALSYVYNENKFATGIDDNINHLALEIDFIPNQKLTIGAKYIYSSSIDIHRLVEDEGQNYDEHHNVFLTASYNISQDQTITFQFGEFVSYRPIEGMHTPANWSLSTLDTQHIFRLVYKGMF